MQIRWNEGAPKRNGHCKPFRCGGIQGRVTVYSNANPAAAGYSVTVELDSGRTHRVTGPVGGLSRAIENARQLIRELALEQS